MSNKHETTRKAAKRYICVLRALEQGISYEEICKQCNVSMYAVTRIAKHEEEKKGRK